MESLRSISHGVGVLMSGLVLFSCGWIPSWRSLGSSSLDPVPAWPCRWDSQAGIEQRHTLHYGLSASPTGEQKYTDSWLFCYSSRAQTKNSSQINSDVKVESATVNLLLWKWRLQDKRKNCPAIPTPRQVSGAFLGTKTNWGGKENDAFIRRIGLLRCTLYFHLWFP